MAQPPMSIRAADGRMRIDAGVERYAHAVVGLLDALDDSLRWHAEHETVPHNSVLNACRSWRFAEAGVWSSKDDAAAWARTHSKDPAIVAVPVALRHVDGSRRLDQAAVRAFVGDVRARLERMPH